MIDQNIIDRIIDGTDIVSLVREYLPDLRRSGANYTCRCPFHEDKDASFCVSSAKNIYKCFGCGEGGNAISFVMKKEGISFPEAVKRLGERLNIEVPDERTPEELRAAEIREALLLIMKQAHTYYQEQVESREARSYLRDRKISKQLAERFSLGYAGKDYTSLRTYLTDQGHPQDALSRVGLLNSSDTDFFRLRILFPYYTVTGKLVGFTGRTTDPAGKIKYLNSPDGDLFHKGDVLFGYPQAKTAAAKSKRCYLVEGQFDCLRLADKEVENVVAGSGTALTTNQAKLLSRICSEVVLVYDGDAAGRKAARRNMEPLLQEGLRVRLVPLPEEHDPDSFFRDMDPQRTKDYLQKMEVNFVQYLLKGADKSDPYALATVVEDISSLIALLPEGAMSRSLVLQLSKETDMPHEDLLRDVRKLRTTGRHTPKEEDSAVMDEGLLGLEEVATLLGGNREREVLITAHRDLFVSCWGESPVVMPNGKVPPEHIQELIRLTNRVRFEDSVEIPQSLEEPEILSLLKVLKDNNIYLSIEQTDRSLLDEGADEDSHTVVRRVYGWTEYYVSLYAPIIRNSTIREDVRSKAIERVSQEIAKTDNTIVTASLGDYASTLGLNKGALQKIVTPLLDKEKKKKHNKESLELDEEEESIVFDTDDYAPDYVYDNPELERIYRQHDYYPILAKDGRKVCYSVKEKGTHKRVGNFYLEPLLHLYHKEKSKNLRIFRLTSTRHRYHRFIEFTSGDLFNHTVFRQRMFEFGDYSFKNGTNAILQSIVDSWTFRKCFELPCYGWNRDGFFAFSNGIYHEVDGEYRYDAVDSLGVVTHNDKNYMIPVFSQLNVDTPKGGADQYLMERMFAFRSNTKNGIDFEEWARLMDEVYKLNDNGKFAIIYAIMCAFRSDIYEIERIFTALFFVGPVGCGKSELAYSIRSLYMPIEAPAYNLTSSSYPALAAMMQKYRDVPLMLEEYNDNIEEVKLQALKAAIYDGQGRQKRKSADSDEIDSNEVNAPLILLGQESPQRDGNSLYSRCIVRDVPKKEDRSDEESQIFSTLKGYEEKGLHHILLRILRMRSTLRQHYRTTRDLCVRQLKEKVQPMLNNTDNLTRTIQIGGVFLTVCRIVEERTDMKLPFSYDQFFNLMSETVVRQIESISATNPIANFFSIINNQIDRGEVKEGRDFKIEVCKRGTLKLQQPGKGKDSEFDWHPPREGMELLYFNASTMHAIYSRQAGKDALKQQTFTKYIESTDYFIGNTKATRFKYTEVEEVAKVTTSAHVTQTSGGGVMEIKPEFDNTVKKVMKNKSRIIGAVVIDYALFKKLTGIDFRRYDSDDWGDEDDAPDESPFAPVGADGYMF
ncbi:MAG: DNA primase [Porphyromonas sp.]|nr:DNA primase [Porphyromonas sp.]